VWAEQHKQKVAKAKGKTGEIINAGSLAQYTIEDIERIVREGAPEGANRSNVFHSIVGHYLGCGWTLEQITEHIGQFTDGIGNRYIAEGRLSGEVRRSAACYGVDDRVSPWSSGRPGKADPDSDPPQWEDTKPAFGPPPWEVSESETEPESEPESEPDSEPGEDEPGEDEPGEDEPDEDEPGEDEPGEDEPGEDEPGEDEPGEDEPGEDEPGEDERTW
jgi:hypothetical protein